MTQPDDERELADMELWSRRIIYEACREHFKQEFNFIEISRLPQRVNSVSGRKNKPISTN